MGIPLYIRIKKADGTRAYVPVAKSNNGKIKPLYGLVDGRSEHHPEGEYNLRITVTGKRKWLPVGSDPAAAVAAKLRREADKAEGFTSSLSTPSIVPVPKSWSPASSDEHQRHNLDEAIAAYLAEAKIGKSKRTYLVYKHTLEAFRGICIAPTVERIRREDVIAYIESRTEAGNSKRTISNHVMHLRTFCNFYGVKLPLKKTDKSLYKYTEKNVQAYSHQDLESLFATANQEDTELFQFFLCSGGRDQEVQFATWSDIDFHRNRFNVTEKLDLGFTPKDKEEGSIPLPAYMIEILKERRKRYPKSRLIFGQGDNRSTPDGHFLRRLQRLAYRAGLNCGQCYSRNGKCCAERPTCHKWILHRFRKTFATMHHENGVSARTIQKWLRHSDLETSLKYLAGADDSTEQMQQKVNSTFVELSL